MFSINSLDGNSFFDIGLKYRQMQIKELGDESYDAPSELRDTEKSSLSSSGDSSFSNFVKSFDKLHSLITAYVYKSDANSNISRNEVSMSSLSKQSKSINTANIKALITTSRQEDRNELKAFEKELLKKFR